MRIRSERRIWDVVEDIHNGQFLLPNIQRPFVWGKEQARNLIDSVLRGYPIGALMVWRPEHTFHASIRCRGFLQKVTPDPDLRATGVYNPADGAYLVLDGQQRLQSLYLAFRGTWDGMALYLNVTHTLENQDDDRLFDLAFFKVSDPPAKNTGYFQLDYLIRLTDPKQQRAFIRQLLKEIGKEDDDDLDSQIHFIVQTVQAKFNAEERLLFQEIDSQLGYSEVLEVFRRVNSGGTKLEASDLAFAIVKLEYGDLEDKIYDLLDDLEKSGFHNFDTDFLIKAALLILGRGAKYDLSRMDDAFLQAFSSHFDALKRAIENALEFLVHHCKIQADRFLRSPNALIPVLDYLMRQRGQDFPQGAQDAARTYLYMSQFFRLFAQGTDAVLNRIHDMMPGTVEIAPTQTYPFPLTQIAEYMTKRQARPFAYDSAMLLDLDLVLNIIHGGVKQLPVLRGWSLERDHIFPRRLLAQLGMDDTAINAVGNLRFCTKARNIRKSDGMPAVDVEFFGNNDPTIKQLFNQARINLTPQTYDAFVQSRIAAIEQQVRGIIQL